VGRAIVVVVPVLVALAVFPVAYRRVGPHADLRRAWLRFALVFTPLALAIGLVATADS